MPTFSTAKEVFALLHKYKPETKLVKLISLKKQTAEQANDKTIIAKRPMHLQQGINKAVTQVTLKKALLVISHDVDICKHFDWKISDSLCFKWL